MGEMINVTPPFLGVMHTIMLLCFPMTGPPVLVQFNIWERGDVDNPALTEQLQLAMRHALCDVITEYRLLTAPVCEPPQDYVRPGGTPLHSAPPSPGLLHMSLGRGLLHMSLGMGLLHMSLGRGLLHMSLGRGLLHITRLHMSLGRGLLFMS